MDPLMTPRILFSPAMVVLSVAILAASCNQATPSGKVASVTGPMEFHEPLPVAGGPEALGRCSLVVIATADCTGCRILAETMAGSPEAYSMYSPIQISWLVASSQREVTAFAGAFGIPRQRIHALRGRLDESDPLVELGQVTTPLVVGVDVNSVVTGALVTNQIPTDDRLGRLCPQLEAGDSE